MENFKKYLERLNLVPRTVNLYVRLVGQWLSWLPVSLGESGYGEVMNYIAYLQKEEKSVIAINRILQSISHYYDYKELANVASGVRLKGEISKAVLPPLSAEELDGLYDCFEVEYVNNKRSYFYQSDKLLLGLMIYQGLEFGDLLVLERSGLDLEKGKLYVPGRRSRLSRRLSLVSHQILPFHEYLIKYREKYASIDSEKLFLPQGTSYD